MTHKSDVKKGFLARLRKDEAGNTLALTAAAAIPLIGMIGGAVDMSRIYLTQSRLQQACDAGALAGRREMGTGTWDSDANTAAQNFFDTNFADGNYGTTGRTRAFTESSQVVTGTASVTVPVSLMKIFGFTGKTINVNCTAEMQIPNTDVMFVLDTTQSMSWTLSGDTQTKIESLRDAVESFYNILEAGKGPDTQIRYGFVPYSVNVNVGYLLQRDWMVDLGEYDTRKATPNGYQTTTGNWTYVSGSKADSFSSNANSCPADTYSYSDTVSTSSGTDELGNPITVTTTDRTQNGSDYTCEQKWNGKWKVWEAQYSNYVSQQTSTYGHKYTWTYLRDDIDVSGLKGSNSDGLMAGGSITTYRGDMSGYKPQSMTVTWNGCIEERETVKTSSYSTVPSGAKDLDIDAVPSTADPETQWKPALAGLTWVRKNTTSGGTNWSQSAYSTDTNYYTPSGPCPTTARKLDEISSSDLTTYLNSLNPTGNTYHDIGMLWGARLLSPTGLFAAENATTPSGAEITRHLIFMTDGDTAPNRTIYTPYGVEPLSLRRTTNIPTDNNLKDVVNARLDYLCTAVKNKNITIWVVAFGTTLTSNLSSCASPGRAYQANNAAALNTAFNDIASQISKLRLTQ